MPQTTYSFSSDRDFCRNVSSEIRSVLRLLAKGQTSVDIADATGFSVESVRAIKANATRGAYYPNVVPFQG